MLNRCKFSKLAFTSLPLLAMLTIGTLPGSPERNTKQLTLRLSVRALNWARNVGIGLFTSIDRADRQILVDAFTRAESGLVNALTKMPAVGRIAITGTSVMT